ncbi:AAA family ATPase [Verrucomicrobia bacterium S94]|nr:AAA family ATPase [Verrucomicrobia bacterium S94]
MNIEIKNCNNIDLANITLAENKLNIKFAPNGTGKSTIAQGIVLGASGSDLGKLLPFKLKAGNPEDKRPEVNGLDTLQQVMCFNEEYVSQFVFKPDELLSNSFEIFIKTDAYRKKEQEIEELVAEIKQLFVNNDELEALIATLKEMGNAFKLTKTGISKASSGMKGLAGGNKIEHIPAGLESYKPFIQSQQSVGWVDWQTKGYDFAELSDNCPFCSSHAADKKEQIKRVGQEYDKNTIKNLVAIIGVIDRLGDYFSDTARSSLSIITTLKDGIEKEHVDFLIDVKNQIDSFVGKLEKLRTLSGFQFKDGDKVAEVLPSYKIDLSFIEKLNSQKTQEAITPINTSIDAMIEKAGLLQGKVAQQRREMQRVVEKHEKDINTFLAYAGYRYAVNISGEGEQAQLKLRHLDHDTHLSGGNQHLSFGERNAFSIVLFMYECLSKKPDLIILDDPISSFDKNKKYAILEMLFRRDANSCLKNKTVLMLTHDVEPIIDTVKALSHRFRNQTTASFLKLKAGIIEELSIEKHDVQTFAEICKNALNSEKDDIIKLIYLRRHFEITDEKGDAYQILSNLLHKRNNKDRGVDTREPRDADGHHPEMEQAKFDNGCAEVLNYLAGFSYPSLLNRITNVNQMKLLYASCTNGYEKLQVCRLIDHDENDAVIEKFIKQTYHIENEFVCQLDPAKFDTIPEYVVTECNKIVEGANG